MIHKDSPMDDLLNEFLTETNEGLALLDTEIVRFEQNPNDPELLGNIFRIMHTIKGTCGFLGLPRLEAVAHASENILGKFRDGQIPVTAAAVTLILESIDKIKHILEVIEQTEQEPEIDNSQFIAQLNAMAKSEDGQAPSSDMQNITKAKQKLRLTAEDIQERVRTTGQEPSLEELDAMFENKAESEEDEDEAIQMQQDDAFVGHVNEKPGIEAIQEAFAQQNAQKVVSQAVSSLGNNEERFEKGGVQQTIRVNVEHLENLMTVVSELVLTRNQLLQILRDQGDTRFSAPLQRLNHVTAELQEGVMKTRMQPIGNAWAKLPRIVRDLSVDLKKKIDLKMLGAETELDRQVLELIKDPLTHMVRNSGDHGIETPEERRKVGKNETGQIILNAYHEGGHIMIEIKDDGRGLNIERIKQKALENNLATADEIAGMSDQQIYQFIFKAGFSTAAVVTNISGRGVGMDVVRSNIEKIGGTIELRSTPGKGSGFFIKIPLTLAIVSALIVEAGKEKFAVPQISVLELVRASKNSEHRIERINDVPVLRLRNRLLPLVSLRNLLQLNEESNQQEQYNDRSIFEDAFIIVTKVGSNSFGIIVDRVYDTEEIVVKPVSPILRDIDMFSGNTILGDGSVIMILDPNGIAAAIGTCDTSHDSAVAEDEKQDASENHKIAILLFKGNDQVPKAVPLALIARLEDVLVNKIETSNGKLVVQYRGHLMPLVKIREDLDLTSRSHFPVLVFSENQRNMGLIVEDILDIVDEELQIELTDRKPGIMGSCIISGKATDVLDTSYYLLQSYPDWFGSENQEMDAEAGKKILLVDDSRFYQNLIGPVLNLAGFKVVTVDSPTKALDLCERGYQFDVIVSDIEMPGMNGFEFAEAVKNEKNWADTPVIALSSHSSPKDLAKGRKVGFSDYVAKNDSEALLKSLTSIMSQVREAV